MFDCVNLQITQTPWKSGSTFKQGQPENSSGMLCTPCGEVDRPTSSSGGRLLWRTIPGTRIGPTEEICLRHRRMLGNWRESAKREEPWDVGLGERVHRRSQNCRLIAAFWKTFQTMRRHKSTGQPDVLRCHIECKGRPWAGTPATSETNLVFCSMLTRSSSYCGVRFCQKGSLVDKTRWKTWKWCSIIMERILQNCQNSEPEHDPRTASTSDSWKAHQPNKDRRYEVCWKEGSKLTGQKLYRRIHESVYQEEPVFIRALQGQSGNNLDISTFCHAKIEETYEPFLYHSGLSVRGDSFF